MIAFALSGGGNRGPIQVGAMRALFERGIVPEMLVGSSAGALNSAYIATNPSAQTNEKLAQLWLETRSEDIFPKPRWRMILRALFSGNGLDDNQARARNFQKYIPPGVATFGDLKARLYLTAADLQSGRMYLYGEKPEAKLIEACLASTALPVVWDPEMINQRQIVDGGVIANVPISIAMEHGATEIYALDLQDAGPYAEKKGVINIALHTIGVQTYQQALRDIQRAVEADNVTLHYISLGDIFNTVDLRDFSHTAEMIEQGYLRAKAYLDNPTPNRPPGRKPGVLGDEDKIPDPNTPPGAVPYQPPL